MSLATPGVRAWSVEVCDGRGKCRDRRNGSTPSHSNACMHAGPARITGRIARKKTERIELKCQDETKQCRPAVAQAQGKVWEDADLQLVVAAGVAERVPVENAYVRTVEKRLLIRREFPVSIRNARSAEH